MSNRRQTLSKSSQSQSAIFWHISVIIEWSGVFGENWAVSPFIIYRGLTFCQKSKKSLERFPRTCVTDGLTDGLTDGASFIRTLNRVLKTWKKVHYSTIPIWSYYDAYRESVQNLILLSSIKIRDKYSYSFFFILCLFWANIGNNF